MRNAEDDLKVCEAATAGPWWWSERIKVGDKWAVRVRMCESYAVWVAHVNETTRPKRERVANAKLIAMAREALPYWIERARDAEAHCNELVGIQADA